MAGRPEPTNTSQLLAQSEVESSSESLVRPAVKTVITSAGRILLVKERHSSGEPFWTLPGGGIDDQETPETAVRREVREELNAEIEVGELLGVCPYVHRSREDIVSMYLVFMGELQTEPIPNPEEGIEDIVMADFDEAPTTLLPAFKERLPTLLDRGESGEHGGLDSSILDMTERSQQGL